MESRFQERPAGPSTFTDITSAPLLRRGLVGGGEGGTAITAAASSGRDVKESLEAEVESQPKDEHCSLLLQLLG